MGSFVVVLFLVYLLPWLVLAITAGTITYMIAKEDRGRFALLTVLIIMICGGVNVPLSRINKSRMDTLRLQEATLFCGARPVVLTNTRFADGLKIGMYDDGRIVSSAVNAFEKGKVVILKPREAPPAGVVLVLKSVQHETENLVLMNPQTGEILAYSTYIRSWSPVNGFVYVDCDREKVGSDRLELYQWLSLITTLLPMTNPTAYPAQPQNAASEASANEEAISSSWPAVPRYYGSNAPSR